MITDKMILKLKQEEYSYEIIFGERLFSEIAKYLRPSGIKRYAIITDSNVKMIHAQDLENALKDEGLDYNIFTFPAGEINKTEEDCNRVIEEMLVLGYGRDTLILALGGGVVGDKAGYIAGKFKRGVEFIHIPTTVVSQSDSSIGGKVGVNFIIHKEKMIKNAIGLIHQPKKIFMDLSTIDTLSDSEYKNGLAEVIKHGVIGSIEFFDFLEKNMDLIMKRDKTTYQKMIVENCKIKKEIVENDPKEDGRRRLLNYGHTVGHAIESLAGLPHGECVSIGMMVSARIANILLGFPKKDLDRQERLLKKAGLMTTIPKDISDEDILRLTVNDKKAEDGVARYCLPETIGKMASFDGKYTIPVDKDLILKAINESR